MAHEIKEYVGCKDDIGEGRHRIWLKSEEIIRCRDCKHYKEVPYHDGTIRAQCSGVLLFVEPHPNGFCAWAERSE